MKQCNNSSTSQVLQPYKYMYMHSVYTVHECQVPPLVLIVTYPGSSLLSELDEVEWASGKRLTTVGEHVLYYT